MSVTTSGNVEPPPLLFGQRSPSPPAFSSPPQSPDHLHHTQTPLASPPQPAQDVDMSTSATLPPPAGQNHDRQEDAMMQDSGIVANGHVGANEPGSQSAQPHTPAVAVEIAAVDEDAMDTSPDNGQDVVLPNGSGDLPEAPGIAPSSPTPNGEAQGEAHGELHGNDAAPPPPTDEPVQAEAVPPIDPPAPNDTNSQPPPPPPPEPIRSDSDSSDEDDGQPPWHPITEDTSSPDEAELKEIEAGTEHSALDHEHWEAIAFEPLDDPEYTPGATGRIEWTIENYNGTRENPNRELVMKSEPVTIGGHEWQIKFYPKGNDSDYLSVYVECLTVGDKESKKGDRQDSATAIKLDRGTEVQDNATPRDAWKPQHAPLPLLDSLSVPKRKSVAAQVSVVLYNPAEPRVNYSRSCLHRFCTGSPDWGWTRFHGPYYDIPHRVRGQRQALLRGDKLAFTGYIRIVEDDTNCLWEHHSRDNPWDSFAMTGLQSLVLGDDTERQLPPGGNMISAIASWMLFKPFRQFLYSFKTVDFEKAPFARPKPLLAALQKLLFLLRTQVKPGAGSVTLDDVLDALEWYGIHERLDKLDVVEIWEILRGKCEEELQDTPHTNAFNDLFGPKKDYSVGTPCYRAPVTGVSTMQESVEKAKNLVHPSAPLPQLLTVELERQEFDTPSRSYVKLLSKVSLDEHINVRDTRYTLYGFVVHKQTLQSQVYHPVLRPEGPASKWYTYTDGKEDNMVKCLTKRQVVGMHGGKTPGDRFGVDPISYVAMYVRDDIAESAFSSSGDVEQWEVPEWIRDEVAKQQMAPPPPPLSPSSIEDPASTLNNEPEQAEDSKPAETRIFQVIDSKAFLEHEGPGVFDAYDTRWQVEQTDFIYSVQLAATDGCKEVREKLAAVIRDVKDPRQIKFWFVDPLRGSFARPNLIGTGSVEYSSGCPDRYIDQGQNWKLEEAPCSWASCRVWVHLIKVEDIVPLPERKAIAPEQEAVSAPTAETAGSEPSVETTHASTSPLPPQEPEHHSEDTPMSEPDEPGPPTEPPQPEVISPEAQDQETELPISQVPDDSAMVEVEVQLGVDPEVIPDPPAVDVVIPNTTALPDTEMGGTQEDILPPPPPSDLPSEPAPPLEPVPLPRRIPDPIPIEELPPDEIYFFLKFFNPEAQVLESRGSQIALKSANVDSTALSMLGLPADQKIEIYEEELTSTRALRNRRSFSRNDLHNAAVIIATIPLADEQREGLAARAAFADINSFLSFRALARNFPTRQTGHFTYNYFSSQYYKGEIVNFNRHGVGTRIYHSGATYTGSFRLGQRHGHGLYTFQNGDTYDGTWEANQQHGTGSFVESATGNTYIGGWKNDKKFGEGVTHWKNAQETERLCRICWEDSADTAFYDCGHVVACLTCARQVSNCPVCRKRVVSAMKLYYVA